MRTHNKTVAAPIRHKEAGLSEEEGERARNLRAMRTIKKEIAEVQEYVAGLDEGKGQEKLANQLEKAMRLAERITLVEMEEHDRRNPDARKVKHRPGFPQHRELRPTCKF